MTTIAFEKKDFWNTMWILYDIIQKKSNTWISITIDDDPDRICETNKNKLAYNKSMIEKSKWESIKIDTKLIKGESDFINFIKKFWLCQKIHLMIV